MYPNLGRRGLLITLILVALMPGWLGTSFAGDDQASKNEKSAKREPADDKVYEPGGDVKPPKLAHYVEPAFSSSSKEAFVEGTVKISTIITSEGVPTDLRVVSGLNTDEDRTAVEALKQWKFQPGTKSGRPVNVKVTVEINFHLL